MKNLKQKMEKEKVKNILFLVNQNMMENISMEKEMEKEKNFTKMVI